MRLIVCNYQWIFHPFIRENFLAFIEKELEDCILILDECHNIIDLATEINSDSISPYSLRICLRDLELYRSPIIMQNFTKILLNHLEKKKQQLVTEEKEIDASHFLLQVYTRLGLSDLNSFNNFLKELQEFSIAIHDERIANGEVSRDFVGGLAEFWLKWVRCYTMENYFFCYTNKQIKGKNAIFIEIVALDPREVVIPILRACYTSLHLSGTVNPYVYNSLMGFKQTGKKFKGIVADSPFKKENIKAVITEGVDTRNENRTPLTYKKMISKIDEVIATTPANLGIFCASYTILKELLANGLETIINNNNKHLFVEESGLSASENAILVNEFKSMALSPNNGAILLGVCGGRNSEGEDYPGSYMNAVIIAGFPYHLPTPRVEAKIKYYNKVFNKQGWNFAYLYPAIQRANQASGRPIRKLEDKGVIIFMDSRFKQKYKWISEWIRDELKIAPDRDGALRNMLSHFWQ
jgi:DNA excision repair protein ERCC-2